MFEWQRMGIMEPDWYEAQFQGTAYSLHMTWDETKWLLCIEEEHEGQPYRVLYDTEAQDIEHAKLKAENWLLASHIKGLEATGSQMLEALENLENDDRRQMPPSIWQMVQEAVQAAGGASKPFTTPAADWRENGEEDPHGTRYDCERHETIGGQYSDDEVANMQFMRSNDLESATIAKDRIRWLSRKVVVLENGRENVLSEVQ